LHASGAAAAGGRNDDQSLLELLGWDDHRERELAPWRASGCTPARVARADRGAVTALGDEGEIRVALRPGARGVQPAVGDWIALRPEAPAGAAEVACVLERRTSFSRRRPTPETAEQVLAANVDVVFLVNALDARLNQRRIERYLALGWQSGAMPVLVLTKADLSASVEAAVAEIEAIAFGVPVHAVAAPSGLGLDALRGYAAPNRTVALLGLSGAGKSTLVNHLCERDVLATQDVRRDGKGRHTTTHRELVLLPGGGVMLDTPGMRGMLLWEADEGLEQTFSDVEALAGRCRFSDCSHEGEPGCAVMAAIRDGSLPQERLVSYRKLQRELEMLARRQDHLARDQRRRDMRTLERSMRLRRRLEGSS
jgi:ribosome biogenesis GTPase